MNQDNKLIGSAIKRNHIRFDLEVIADLIDPKSKVLDIGCGTGELLKYLKDNKDVYARGLEISQNDVSMSVGQGISVIHGDAENDLVYYPDNCFDYAVLSHTIQTMQNPKEVLEQMLRIAKYAIVSLPNFAHFRNRLHLLLKGQMPVNKTIPYQWFDTPNIHFCSIKDFEKLCLDMNFDIKKRIYLTSNGKLAGLMEGKILANFFAEYGIFLITKNEMRPVTEPVLTVNKKSTDFLIKSLNPASSLDAKH